MIMEDKNQWTGSYPSRTDVDRDIRSGVGFVFEIAGEVIAYGAVVFDGEAAYDRIDGEWISGLDYVVVHRLAVRQDYERKGMATAFFESVEELALSAGIHSFRIDTNYDNDRMLALLRKSGFKYCGEVHYLSGQRKAFEKLL